MYNGRIRLGVTAVVTIVACANRKAPPAPSAEPAAPHAAVTGDAMPADAAGARFVRVDPDQVIGLWPQAFPKNEDELPSHIEVMGLFLCRLETRFGRGDLHVLLTDGVPKLGFPLRDTATGQLVVPMVDGLMGYAGEASDRFAATARDLDALVSSTTPRDCEYTFPEHFRIDHAGVRGGKPFFEHLGLADTLEFRLAQFAYNDEHGGEHADEIERVLCDSAAQNWKDRAYAAGMGTKGSITANAPGFDAFAHKRELKARLVRCMERDLAEIEHQIADDSFDADAMPSDIDALDQTYRDIVGNGPLSARIRKARAAVARGHHR